MVIITIQCNNWMTKTSLFLLALLVPLSGLGESLSGLHPNIARQLLPLPLLGSTATAIHHGQYNMYIYIYIHISIYIYTHMYIYIWYAYDICIYIYSSIIDLGYGHNGNIGSEYGWFTIYEALKGVPTSKGYHPIIQVMDDDWLSSMKALYLSLVSIMMCYKPIHL